MKVLIALLAVLVAVLINTTLIMLSWNYVGVDVLGLKTITFFQAMVLGVLAQALFKGAQVKTGES